jgi:thiol:disulfide interchange protein DsbA
VIRRLFLGFLLMLPALAMSSAASAQQYVPGEDYAVVTPAQPGGTDGKVQVVELFWYGCPHCFQFEPTLHDWVKSKPANVEFIRIPAIFNNPRWQLHAGAFYTAEVLGVMDKFHEPFFNIIHIGHQRMGTREDVRDFFAGIGVDGKTFDDTFDSFAVQAKVRRAADLTRKYGISGVPSLVVNGKYVVDGPMAKSYENMLRIVNALVKKETAAQQ